MIKLIRLFGLFVVICLIYGLGSAFNGTESSNVVDTPIEQSTETVDNSILENYVSTEIVEDNSEYQDQNDVGNSQNASYQKQDNKKNNDVEETDLVDNDVSLNEKKQEIIEKNSEIINNNDVNNQKDSFTENIDKSQEVLESEDNIESQEKIESVVINEEISSEETIEVIDEEYERLKNLYKYPNATECYNASLKVYSETYNENYKNFGCISGAYNGELLGYRIIIYYNDGTSMYYD